MLNYVRRPSLLVFKGRNDRVKAFEQAIFSLRIIVELALLLYFLTDAASTLINEFIRREQVWIAFRISLEADWVLSTML